MSEWNVRDLMDEHDSWSRKRYDPMSWFAMLFDKNVNHVVHDPKMKPSEKHFKVWNQMRHDGTLCHTHELVGKMLTPLAQARIVAKDQVEPEGTLAVKYTVSDLWLLSVFSRKMKFGDNVWAGERERAVLYVQCEFVTDPEEAKQLEPTDKPEPKNKPGVISYDHDMYPNIYRYSSFTDIEEGDHD